MRSVFVTPSAPSTTVVLGLLLLACAWTSGCKSGESPRSNAMASVRLHTATTEEVRQAIFDVFQENYYQVGETNVTRLTFEQPGTRMDKINYGGFFEDSLWRRIKVTISRFGDKAHLVEADAYIVRHYEEGFFEEEQKLYRWNKGRYQDLLDEVAARLEGEASK